ncbi:MAG TPA: hypothetical protein VM008_11225 [Phycisphaerae bacterium]|nr:hypothetical protein [Phycisphaerae bacterium]
MVGMIGKKWLPTAAAFLIALTSIGVVALQADQGPAGAITASSATQPSPQPAKTKEQKFAEDSARVLEFFRLNQPYVYDQALSLQKSDPARFEWTVTHAIGTVKQLESLQKRNKPLFDLKLKDFELTYSCAGLRDQIKRPDISSADRDSLIKQLTDKLNEQFENGQKIRAAQIEDLKKELAECEQNLQNRAAQKDEWIKKQLDELIGGLPVAGQ